MLEWVISSEQKAGYLDLRTEELTFADAERLLETERGRNRAEPVLQLLRVHVTARHGLGDPGASMTTHGTCCWALVEVCSHDTSREEAPDRPRPGAPARGNIGDAGRVVQR
jgi:hypothetical protein